MILNPDLVYYACIAKGSTILVEFSLKQVDDGDDNDDDIESLALKCIEKTPPHHSRLSHTIRNRTYMYLIDDPIVYFAIFDKTLDRIESNWFLDQAKFNFEQLLASGAILSFDNVTSHCFQSHLREIFHVGLPEVENSGNGDVSNHSRNLSLESSGGKKGLTPLLGKHIKAVFLKKKKRSYGGANGDSRDVSVQNESEVCEVNGTCKDIYVPMHKNGGNYPGDRQKAKQVCNVLTVEFCGVSIG
ncbi:hypothetical protein ACFE04_010068 [Oxalis oulophora]